MWTKRYLAVWILVASALLATPTTAPTLTEPTINFGSMSIEEISKAVNSFLGSIGNTFAPLFDGTSSDDVNVLYKDAIDGLKKIEWNPCVRKLCEGNDMKVWDMRLSFDQTDIQMKVTKPAKDSDSQGGLVIASVRFTFPSHMKLSAKFKYEGTLLMVSYTKVGEAEFEVGPVTVTVNAKLPDTKTALKKVPNDMECQYRMQPRGVVTAFSGNFEILKVNYKSTTRHDYSKANMIESFKKMKDRIIANVATNLESHVVEQTKKVMFSCLDAEAQQKWTSQGTSADCAAETCD